MKQSKETPLFKDFMTSSVVVSYSCNRHACKNGTKPRMVTQKDWAHILSAERSLLIQTKTERQ